MPMNSTAPKLLKAWTDGTETYVAETLEEARAMQREATGFSEEDQAAEWYARDSTKLLRIYFDDEVIEKSVGRWITENGPGFLCSTEF